MQTATSCDRCGTDVSATASFCHNCGAALSPVRLEPESKRAPWTLADIAKAAAVPVAFFALGFGSSLFLDESPEDRSSGGLAFSFSVAILFEMFLVFLVWWFTIRKYRVSLRDVGIRSPARGGPFFPLLLVGIALVTAYVYGGILYAFGVEAPDDPVEGAYDSVALIALLASVSLIFAPVAEELFFRGFVFTGMRRVWGVPVAAVASGLLFAILHVGEPSALYTILPPIVIIGAIFAWGYHFTSSIFPSTIAHVLFNSVVLTLGIVNA